MPNDHAKLSPSGASRWLECTPSANREAAYPDRTNDAAEEGTVAHAIAEIQLLREFKLEGYRSTARALKYLKASDFYNATMQEYVDDYVAYVVEVYNAIKKHTPDAVIHIEKRIDLTTFIPEGFGTGDAVIVGEGVAHMIDLKYGKGVSVAAEDNSQLKIYGLGILDEYKFVYGLKEVNLHIYQPRMGNISSWTVSAATLLNWGLNYLRDRAALAFKGEGEFVAGSHCKFCRFAGECKALAEYNLEITKHDFRDANKLSDADIAEILSKADAIKSWLNTIEKHALQYVLGGGLIPNYKVVEGRSNRTLPKENVPKVKRALTKLGLKKADMVTEKLISLTDMEKKVGRKVFAEKMAHFFVKPQGKPTLVTSDDKREEYAPSSVQDFEGLEGVNK